MMFGDMMYEIMMHRDTHTGGAQRRGGVSMGVLPAVVCHPQMVRVPRTMRGTVPGHFTMRGTLPRDFTMRGTSPRDLLSSRTAQHHARLLCTANHVRESYRSLPPHTEATTAAGSPHSTHLRERWWPGSCGPAGPTHTERDWWAETELILELTPQPTQSAGAADDVHVW